MDWFGAFLKNATTTSNSRFLALKFKINLELFIHNKKNYLGLDQLKSTVQR